MTAISGLAPHPSNNLLITSEEEHLELLAKEVEKAISAHLWVTLKNANLVAQYAHDKSLTNWHTALSRLNMLPKQIPPLYLNSTQIQEGICSVSGSFYLVPSKTVNQFVESVEKYGARHLSEFEGSNPFRFRYFWEAARQEHGDTQFKQYEWRWMSDDILADSRGQSNVQQAQIVAKLGKNFEIPSLKDVVACLFLYKAATKQSLLRQGNDKSEVNTYTRVQETTQDCHLAVGGSLSCGVSVTRHHPNDEEVGVVALAKF